VKFINTDGMAFIGPGSEWFWTALSGIILAVTFIAIYRQLRAQSAANAVHRMEALQGQWNSERMIHARLTVAIWRKHADGPSPSIEAQAALGYLLGFFENLSDLEEDGNLTWKEVYNSWGELLVIYWAYLHPRSKRNVAARPRCSLGSSGSPGEPRRRRLVAATTGHFPSLESPRNSTSRSPATPRG
jgi:hypothetical protein